MNQFFESLALAVLIACVLVLSFLFDGDRKSQRRRIECLRGGLKSASGRFLDVGDLESADDCLRWAGDMEPPLMGSNAKIRGPL